MIKKFRLLLDSERKITKINFSNRYNYATYKIEIGSKKICNTLLNLGVHPNKSKTIRYPPLEQKYDIDRHFIRGEFDGDGTVCLHKMFDKRRNYYREQIYSGFASGSYEFLKELRERLISYNITKAPIVNGTRCFCIQIHHYDSLKLFDFMYKDIPSSIYNERKHNKFLEIIEKTKYVKCLDCNNKIIRNLDNRLCKVCQKTSIHYLRNRKYIARGTMKGRR